MKKAVSYIWPLTKKVTSKFSGTLEVTWLNGKKVLDSENANYSYGSLEKVLDFALSHCRAERASQVLVLGLGGGSVLKLLRKKFNYTGKITAVEIDPAVIDLAITEFNINEYEPLDINCEDAFTFVEKTSGHFGLIIIDIFIDVKVPPQFFSSDFWQHISRLLEDAGEVIFNTGIHSENLEETSQVQEEITSIDFRRFEDVLNTNTLLLGTKKA